MGWFRVGGPRLLAAAICLAVAVGSTFGSSAAFGNPPGSSTSTTAPTASTSTSTTLPPLPSVPAADTNGQPVQKLLGAAMTLVGLGLDDSSLEAAVSVTQAKLEADSEVAERADADAAAAAQLAQSAQARAAMARSEYVDMQAAVQKAVVYLYTTGSDQLAVNPSAGPLLIYAQDYAESTLSPYGVLDQRKAVEEEMKASEETARRAAVRQRAAATKAQAARADEERQLQHLETELAQVSTSGTAVAIAADHLALAGQAGQELTGTEALQFTPKSALPAPLATTNVALTWAFAELGKEYVWGATGPDTFDCSGLTQYVWKAAGVNIPRVAVDQDAWTVPVPLSDLLPGDLVFFGTEDIHHVGIYIGGGLMINAPHTGTVVQVSSIWWSDLAGFGRVHDPKVPVPVHMPPSAAQPAPISVVAVAGPVPSQPKPPAGWVPHQGSTTPIVVNVSSPPQGGSSSTSSSTTLPGISGTDSTIDVSVDPGSSTSTSSTTSTSIDSGSPLVSTPESTTTTTTTGSSAPPTSL